MKSDRLNWFLTVAANLGVVLGLGFLAYLAAKMLVDGWIQIVEYVA